MSRSFSPPRIRPSRWLSATVLAVVGAGTCLWVDLHWLFPLLFLGAAGGLGYGTKRAFAQQRLANAATLYSLETGHVTPEDKRPAA